MLKVVEDLEEDNLIILIKMALGAPSIVGAIVKIIYDGRFLSSEYK